MPSVTMLTAAQTAARHHLSEQDLWVEVRAGRFPAPDKLGASGPHWFDSTVEDPKPRVRTPSRPMSREDHLMHLFDELVVWALDHGNTDVPQTATGRPGIDGRPFPLGARVSAVRTAYNKGKLSKEEIARFESLPGWAWDHLDHQWRLRFASVLSRWPDRTTATDRAWISTQRLRWDQLKPSWRALFDMVPGLIDAQPKSRVDVFVAQAQRWLDANPGKTMADVTYPTLVDAEDGGDPYRLGKTALYYRRRRQGLEGKGRNVLPDDEAKQLEQLPGWDWTIRS